VSQVEVYKCKQMFYKCKPAKKLVRLIAEDGFLIRFQARNWPVANLICM
jgi:hypothetical protein